MVVFLTIPADSTMANPIAGPQNHARSHPAWQSTRPPKSRRMLTSHIATSSSSISATTSVANPLGIHGLCFSGEITKAGMQKAILGAKQNGYDLLEIPLLNPEEVDVPSTNRLLAEHNLTPSASLGLRLDADISSADAECAARGEELLRSALYVANKLGVHHLCGVIYSAIDKYPGPPTAEGRDNSIRALRRIAAEAKDLGMVLCCEVINRYESNLLNTAAQAREFIEEIGADNVMIHLDTFHINIEEPGFAAAVATAGEKLAYVHIGESHRGYLGTGTIDFQEFFRSLADLGYQGPVTFESFSSRVVSPYLSTHLCVWRDLWDDSDVLATQAREFMVNQIESANKYKALQQ